MSSAPCITALLTPPPPPHPRTLHDETSTARGEIGNCLARLRIDVPKIRSDAIRIFQLALDMGQGKLVLEDERYRHVDLGSGVGATRGVAFEGGNMVQGRKSNQTCASCVYLACRRNAYPIMLIEVADVTGVNVFVLGRSYLRLAYLLRYDPAMADAHRSGSSSSSSSGNGDILEPSLYIRRFASLLDFGDETEAVVEDALRLCTRFKHDWLSSGRRPSGISGACLLLAARMNNFRRSVAEIVQVVKVADGTLKKRLDEFRRLPAAQLSIEAFRASGDAEHLQVEGAEQPLPPSSAVNQAKERERLARIRQRRRIRNRGRWRKAREEYGLGSDFELDDEEEEEDEGLDGEDQEESDDEEEEGEQEEAAAKSAGEKRKRTAALFFDDPEAAAAASSSGAPTPPPTAGAGDSHEPGDTDAAAAAEAQEQEKNAAAVEESVDAMLTEEVQGLLESEQLKEDLRKEEERQARTERLARMTAAERKAALAKEREEEEAAAAREKAQSEGGRREGAGDAQAEADGDGDSAEESAGRPSKRPRRGAQPEAGSYEAEGEEEEQDEGDPADVAAAGLLAMHAGRASPGAGDDAESTPAAAPASSSVEMKRVAKEALREARRAEKRQRRMDKIAAKRAERREERRKRAERRKAERLAAAAAEEEGGNPFEGLDEAELDEYLLDEEESKVKARIWTEFNKEWLQEALEKQLKEEEDLRNGIEPKRAKARKKKDPAVVRDSTNPMGIDAVDSATQFLKKKLPQSSKINYEALNSMMRGVGGGGSGSQANRRGTGAGPSSSSASSRRRATREGTTADPNLVGRAASRAVSEASTGAGADSDYLSESAHGGGASSAAGSEYGYDEYD